MLKKLLNLQLFGLCALMFVLVCSATANVLAQDPLTETYTTMDGTLSFKYPGDWVIAETGDRIILASSQEVLENVDQPLSSGQVVISIHLESLPVGTSAQDAANTFADTIRQRESALSIMAPVEITIGGNAAARINLATQDKHMILIMLDVGNGVYVSLLAESAVGEMQQFEQMLLDIASTVEYASSQIAVLEGHAGAVSSVTWSPDGTRLASGSRDGTVQLWDAASGQLLRVLADHTDTVSSVAWSPDGTRLASASYDGTVRLWDVVSGQRLLILEGHTDAVLGVAWSPDGTRLASGSEDGTVRLWDAATGALSGILEGHIHWVDSVAWSPDGTRLASGSWDLTIRIWDATWGTPLAVLEGHAHRVEDVAWSPDGTRLASASRDSTVRVWDAASGQSLRVLEGDMGLVYSVVWSPDGATLASASSDGIVWLWNMVSGQPIRTLEGHTRAVNSVAWSPDGTTLASGGADGTVRLWGLPSYNTSTLPTPTPNVQEEVAQREETPTHTELPEIYTSSEGTFSFRYPRGWALEEDTSVSVIALSNADGALRNDNPGSGEVLVVLYSPTFVESVFGIQAGTGPIETLGALQEFAQTGEEDAVVSEPVEVEGSSMARAVITDSDSEGMFLAIEAGDGITWVMTALSARGEFAQFEPVVLAIAETLSAAPIEAQIGFEPVTSPTAPSVVVSPTSNPIPQDGVPATVTAPNLNVRQGPGTAYPSVGTLDQGDTIYIVGRNADNSWWAISHEDGTAWVFAGLTAPKGDVSTVPLIDAPQLTQ